MNQEEQSLRKNIRQLIRHVKQKRLDEEKQIDIVKDPRPDRIPTKEDDETKKKDEEKKEKK